MHDLLVTGPDPKKFQGGISLFSALLAKHLDTCTPTRFSSWKRPYPDSLFSGDSSGDSDFPELDVLSPTTWAKFVEKVQRKNVAAVIFNWVHPVQSIAFSYLIKKLHPIPSWVVCHNIYPHEAIPGSKLLFYLALKNAAGLVVHSEPCKQQAQEIFPKKTLLRLELPVLDDHSVVQRNTPRSGTELLCFGHLRPYKGIETLLKAFAKVKQQLPAATLTIAGKPLVASLFPGAKTRYLNSLTTLKEQLTLGDSVRVLPEYLPLGKLQALFETCDLAVFPFHEVTASASILSALSAGVPVVASDLPGLTEVVQPGRNGLLARARDPESLAAALLEALEARFSPDTIRGSIRSRNWNEYCGRFSEAILENRPKSGMLHQ